MRTNAVDFSSEEHNSSRNYLVSGSRQNSKYSQSMSCFCSRQNINLIEKNWVKHADEKLIISIGNRMEPSKIKV